MLRTPRSLNVHPMREPTGAATRLSGVGRLRICSTVNDARLPSSAARCGRGAAATNPPTVNTRASRRRDGGICTAASTHQGVSGTYEREHLVALLGHQILRHGFEIQSQKRLGVRGPDIEMPVLELDG